MVLRTGTPARQTADAVWCRQARNHLSNYFLKFKNEELSRKR